MTDVLISWTVRQIGLSNDFISLINPKVNVFELGNPSPIFENISLSEFPSGSKNYSITKQLSPGNYILLFSEDNGLSDSESITVEDENKHDEIISEIQTVNSEIQDLETQISTNQSQTNANFSNVIGILNQINGKTNLSLEQLKLILGMVQNNYVMDNFVYSESDILEKARIRLFDSPQKTEDATRDSSEAQGAFAVYQMDAELIRGRVRFYKVKRVQ